MVFPEIKGIAIGIIIVLIQLWLYINADYVYGSYAETVRNVMLAYFILLALLSPFVIKVLMGISINDIPNFTITFIITAIIMFAIGTITTLWTGELEAGLKVAFGFGFLHSLVKAFNEEVIFRGVMPQFFGKGYIADIISSVAFGVFHVAVTGGAWTAIIFLSALGFIWTMVKNKFGVMGSTGSHFAYNLSVLGVLPKLLGG